MNMDERVAALDASIGVAETALVDANARYEGLLCSGATQAEIRAAYGVREAARDHLNARIDAMLDETSIQRAGWSVVEKDGDGEDLG